MHALRYVRDHRCFLLMVSLFATLAIAPWLESVGARTIVALLVTAAFASAVHAVGERRHAWVAAVVGTAALVSGAVARLTGSESWAVPALALFAVAGTYTLVRLLIYVVQPAEVSADKVYAGIAVYLLAGFVWGGLFTLAEILAPGSFQLAGSSARTPAALLESFVYFSFVTIVSLGYGDVLPLTPGARSLAVLEALSGTFYLVVIIARLVGAYATTRNGEGRRP